MQQENLDIIMYEYDYGLIYLKYVNHKTADKEDWYIDPIKELNLSKKIDDELVKLGEIYGNILNMEEPDPQYIVGFRSIEEVKYYFYYTLYVATLLSSEYKQGKVFLHGKGNAFCSVEEYIQYLSTLTDEDLKVWLRADLQ